jgi:hypothetical protein
MVNLFGCSGEKFAKYSSKDPQINISMDYIEGWKYDESRGSYNSYTQVIFYPFKKGAKSLKALIDLTIRDGSKMGLGSLTLDAAEKDIVAIKNQADGRRRRHGRSILSDIRKYA